MPGDHASHTATLAPTLSYASPAHASGALNKLPHITLGFWILKICATTLGETGGDLASKTLQMGYMASTIMFFAVLVVFLAIQLAVKKYHPYIYWFVILATSTVGTTMSDYMDRTLHLGYMWGTAILLTLLITTLAVWFFTGESMSVDKIRSRKVEILYWVAIIFSNTLGTALGDFLADDSGLGFRGGAILIGSLIAATALAFYLTKITPLKIPHVILFWIAFILTRPFGAEFGDVLTRGPEDGGFGFGTWVPSVILLAILILGIIIVTIKVWRQPASQPVLITPEP